MEQLILKRLGCDGPVQRINTNGEDVALMAIARRVGALFDVLGNRFYPVCVIFDRETRQQAAEALEAELAAELIKLGYPADQFVICCCDRMIENWILADPESCADHLGGLDAQADGCHGKSVLRASLNPATTYRETTLGVSLFARLDPRRVYARSASFRRFVDRLAFDCDWLAGVKA